MLLGPTAQLLLGSDSQKDVRPLTAAELKDTPATDILLPLPGSSVQAPEDEQSA